MSATVRRFPRKRGAPKQKPCCGQCGREMTGLFPREHDELAHELQTGVTLNLRVFSMSSDPQKCGPIEVRITDDEFRVGWNDDRQYFADWHELIAILKEASEPESPVRRA